MQELFWEELKLGLSEARLEGYRRSPQETEFDCVLRYLWNSRLSESFYIPLQNLEVVLRNRIHSALTNHYGTDMWFDIPRLLQSYQPGQIVLAKKKLSSGDRSNAGKIVAELSFGFWSALVARRYSASLVPVLLKDCFRKVPSNCRRQQYLSVTLNDLRKFRNRVFHHEPIWHLRDLAAKFSMIMQLVLWLSPPLYNMTYPMTYFNDVYSKGTLPYKEIVLNSYTAN